MQERKINLIMFDIDGTLIKSYDYDSQYFLESIQEILEISIDNNWSKYTNVTDAGILDEIIKKYSISENRNIIHNEVKNLFIKKTQNHLELYSSDEIKGAKAFLDILRKRDDVILAMATGGWEETAKLKLSASGIDFSNIAFASSSDHNSRTKIMKLAQKRCNIDNFISKTYFGDGIWDKDASETLGYNFILVGNKLENPKQIDDFSSEKTVLHHIGL